MRNKQQGKQSWIRIHTPEAHLRAGPSLDESEVKKITEATKLTVKAGTDLLQLGQDLARCSIYRHILKRFRERAIDASKEAKNRSRHLKGVIALPDAMVAAEVKEHLCKTLEDIEKNPRNQGPSLPVSDMERLVGKYLAEIFERTFPREAGFLHHGTTQEPTGPFVRFVEKTLAANGIKYAPSSVKKALDRVAEAEAS